MSDSTLEEARRCPRCESPGKLASTNPTGRHGDLLHVYECLQPRCKWYKKSGWVVQVRRDGSIVQPQGHDKSFRIVPDRTDEWQNYYQKLYEDTLNPGSEIRNL
jgi:hypothetical protein